MNTTFKIYVADLERYNAGFLVGKWFDLFDYTDVEDLQEDIQEMLDENNNEEWAIHDTDTEISGIGEYTSLEKLFTIKEALEEDEEKTLAFLEYFCMDDFFSVSEWDDVHLYCGVNSDSDLGYYLIDDMGMLEVPENLQNYFNYEAFGRDFSINASGGFTSYGFIEWN